jgi:hypothetical protein
MGTRRKFRSTVTTWTRKKMKYEKPRLNVMKLSVLHQEAASYRSTPSEARTWLQETIALLTSLVDEPSDRKRVRTFAEFEARISGYQSLRTIVFMSALANPSEAILAIKKKHQQAIQKDQQETEERWQGEADILTEGTGIPKKLAYKILMANRYGRPFHPSWPIKSGGDRSVATGPKGSMPLMGDDSPWEIWETRQAREARQAEAMAKLDVGFPDDNACGVIQKRLRKNRKPLVFDPPSPLPSTPRCPRTEHA